MIESLLAKFGVHIAGLLGFGVLLAALKKYLPGLVASLALKNFNKLLDVKDPADRDLVLALMIWAEKKIPDRGKGRERWEMVVSHAEKIFPGVSKHHKEFVDLVEELMSRLDEELKKQK